MGRIKKGIFGGFSGKVGNVVGANWRSIEYMRGLPKPSSKPATLKQLTQRNKMILLRGFLLGLDETIEKCFQNIVKHTPMNDALSYNLLCTIDGEFPEQNINFSQLLFSKGELRGTWLPKATSTVPNAIDFNWENGTFMSLCAMDDQVNLVVYNPTMNQFCMFNNASVRSDQKARLILPKTFKGHSVHCYISLYSESRKTASTNEYLGTVEVL